MSVRTVLAASGVLAACLGCSGDLVAARPVPAERADLVGAWSNDGVDLGITADGMVHYRRHRGVGELTVDGPVSDWTPGGFVIGAFGLKLRTFVVDVDPHAVGDHWEATIDGERLTRP